ncbi:hypothetical protein [Microbacterium marmarense]|uniref:Secreted protein n=1 Tax=Microbacterium marmarense TaxID=3122051 RepID=A0ABU8LV05_9MICO
MTRISKIILTVGVALGALTVGSVGGAAVAQTSGILAPWGVTTEDGDEQTMPKPDYNTNHAGQTYGSAALAPTPELEPDLIEAMATNGKIGYVIKSELDIATGAAAVATFKSPEEALAWQEARSAEPIPVTVYEQDGRTVVGTFLVDGRK